MEILAVMLCSIMLEVIIVFWQIVLMIVGIVFSAVRWIIVRAILRRKVRKA